jgi:ribosomal-protein-alanine N-acetyltransferase
MNHVYAYSLKPEPFRAFLDGYKRVEMRLFDEKRRLLKPGDFLRFENEDNPEEHFLFEVTALVRFPSFQELYAAYRPEEIGYHPETAPSYRDMERYYPEEKIRQYGALAIEGTMVEEEGGSPLLFTERLVLRPFQKGDSPAMYAGWCNDEEVARWCTWNRHQSSEETEKYLHYKLGKYPSSHDWAITLDGALIGSIDEVNSDPLSFELGYLLGEKWWGLGYMSEAFHAVLRWYFTHTDKTICYMSALMTNARSRHVIEKQGFTLIEENHRLPVAAKGSVELLAVYALQKADFRE